MMENTSDYFVVGENITSIVSGFSVSVVEYPRRSESLRWMVCVEPESGSDDFSFASGSQKHKAIQDVIDNLRDKMNAIEAVIDHLERINAG